MNHMRAMYVREGEFTELQVDRCRIHNMGQEHRLVCVVVGNVVNMCILLKYVYT